MLKIIRKRCLGRRFTELHVENFAIKPLSHEAKILQSTPLPEGKTGKQRLSKGGKEPFIVPHSTQSCQDIYSLDIRKNHAGSLDPLISVPTFKFKVFLYTRQFGASHRIWSISTYNSLKTRPKLCNNRFAIWRLLR